jgi:hypothetical protein
LLSYVRSLSLIPLHARCCLLKHVCSNLIFDQMPIEYWENTLGCSSRFTSQTLSSILNNVGGSTVLTTFVGDGAFNAFSVQIRWQATDIATQTSMSSTTSPPTSASTSAAGTGVTSTGSSMASNQLSSSGGLIPGAAAGNGVGVTAVVLLLLGGIVFAVWRRRISRWPQDAAHIPPGQTLGKAPKSPGANHASMIDAELPSDHQSMMMTPPGQVSGPPAEMLGSTGYPRLS